jgi:hypothetical protein
MCASRQEQASLLYLRRLIALLIRILLQYTPSSPLLEPHVKHRGTWRRCSRSPGWKHPGNSHAGGSNDQWLHHSDRWDGEPNGSYSSLESSYLAYSHPRKTSTPILDYTIDVIYLMGNVSALTNIRWYLGRLKVLPHTQIPDRRS